MGKDKSGQRTKNNARPSSSGRSAEMLGTTPINPFVSFMTFNEKMGLDEQMSDAHLDPNFQLVLKKMNKKDGITKLKALQEFSQLCDSSEPDQLLAILPFWPRLYCALALDVEHRVREAAHIAHRAVVVKVKRNIAPYLRQLAGPWFVAQCDTYAPAGSAASLAFNEAFPPKKIAEAIAFCQEEILTYIYDNLIIHTPQTLCSAKTMTKEEAESKYIRTVISSLQGYGLYLAHLTSDQLQSAKKLNQKLVSDEKFWKFSKHESSQVRSAWFGTLIALCQKAKFLVTGEEKRIGQAVFGSLDENDATVLPVVWEAALVALVNMDGLLKAVSFEKLVLPKLFRVCREGGKGSAAAIFPSLLPLLSKMPLDIVRDDITFHSKFLSSVWQGFSHKTVELSPSESKAVASAFVECLQYIIQLNTDNEFRCQKLLEEFLLPSVCHYIQSTKRSCSADALYLNISKLLHSWGRSAQGSLQRKLLKSFCHDLRSALKSMADSKVSEVQDHEKDTGNSQDTVINKADSENPIEQGKKGLKDVLQSQVYFITFLMEKQSRSLKVKFAGAESQNVSTSHQLEEINCCKSEVAQEEINVIAKDLCCFYMQAVITSECPDYLSALGLLSKLLKSPSFYSDLSDSLNISSEQELFLTHLINWLKPQSSLFCHSAVSFSAPLLSQLSIDQQNFFFEQLLQWGWESYHLLWLVEECVSLGGAGSKLLRSPSLSDSLITLAEKAATSEDVLDIWDLFSSGFDITSDGGHVFSNDVLVAVIDIVTKKLELFHLNSICPSWTATAAKIVLKVYCEESPVLQTLPGPHRILSLAFEICLLKPTNLMDEKALTSLWKDGVKALARVNGYSSFTVLALCSSFKDAVLKLLFAKPSYSGDYIHHTANLLSEFVLIVTDCFSNIDSSQERRVNCSLLLTCLFIKNSDDSTRDHVQGEESILSLQIQGLEALADCVDPFHVGIDCSQNIPKSSLTELVGAGYWSAVVALVLKNLSNAPSFENIVDDSEPFFSSEVFLYMFVLSSDIACIAQHYPFSALGGTFEQLLRENREVIGQVMTTLKQSQIEKLHEILFEKSQNVAAFKRAHRYWHCYFNGNSSGYFHCLEASMTKAAPNVLDDENLKLINLSSLDVLSEKLLENGPSDETNPQVMKWIDIVHKLLIGQNARFVSNKSLDTCAVAVISDTLKVLKFFNAVVSCSPDLLGGRNWDQVMIALASWIHCSHASLMDKPKKQQSSVSFSRKTCAFIVETCKLYVSFCHILMKLQNSEIDLIDADRGSLKESLPCEWNDVFAADCEHKILDMWKDTVRDMKRGEESPPVVALLNHLGEALQISSTRFLQPSKQSEVVYEYLLKFTPPYLLHYLTSVQLTAFYLLHKIIPYMVKHDGASFNGISNAVDKGKDHINSEERLSILQFEDVLAEAQTVVSTMLSDIKLGTSCTLKPFTDSYTYTSGYLLVWSLVLEMCREAETGLMCQYAIWLKSSSGNYAETFLNNVFRLLPQEAFDETSKKSLDFFSRGPSIFFGASWTSALIEHLACNDLYGVLSCLPALARQWWTNADPKSASVIDRVVSKHFSPRLCEAEMSAVSKMQDKAVENMSVRAHPNVREVVAVYTVDDLAMELVVRLPSNHPLSPMIVEVGKQNDAAAVQWRRWLMQLTMFLTHQNGSLWDGLTLWRNNVVRRYEGVEECYICFCVLSGANYQLPKLSCHTCRKKFHSNCLYKWFETSNKSTCPICRNLF